MTLDDLIGWLKNQPREMVVRDGFGSPHCDRGDYSKLAFDPMSITTIGEMLDNAELAKDQDFIGWKGGTFNMRGWTDVLIGEDDVSGEGITSVHFKYWVLTGQDTC